MIQIHDFEVTASIFLNPRVKHIALKPAQGVAFNYIPGQFITIHFSVGEKVLRRSYSIASIPGRDNTIDFAASYVEGGPGSAYLFNLNVGDTVKLSGPFGRLILKEEEGAKRLFLMATGTGVTPYRAMIPELLKLLDEHPDVTVYIVQGAQYRNDLLYVEDFLSWAQQFPERAIFYAYLSREQPSEAFASHERSGYVQSLFDNLQMDINSDMVYLCGNPNMIDHAFAQLQAKGMPTHKIKREKYISAK